MLLDSYPNAEAPTGTIHRIDPNFALFTLCGKQIGSTPGWMYSPKSSEVTCKTCQRLMVRPAEDSND